MKQVISKSGAGSVFPRTNRSPKSMTDTSPQGLRLCIYTMKLMYHSQILSNSDISRSPRAMCSLKHSFCAIYAGWSCLCLIVLVTHLLSRAEGRPASCPQRLQRVLPQPWLPECAGSGRQHLATGCHCPHCWLPATHHTLMPNWLALNLTLPWKPLYVSLSHRTDSMRQGGVGAGRQGVRQ